MQTSLQIKPAVLVAIGGFLYFIIEMLFRGYSHPAMFFVGGLAFYCVGSINAIFPWEMSIILQSLIAGVIITALELVSGCIFNLLLGWHIWDYSNVPFNLLGQVCLQFSIAWIFLGTIAIMLDDFLRWKLFGEEKPHYKFL